MYRACSRILTADTSVLIVVEIAELCLIEVESGLLEVLEFQRIDIATMITIGQV